MVNNSQTVSVTAAPATSYVGVTNLGFQTPSPAVAIGNTLQWDFVGPGAHSATDNTSGLGLFPDTGLVSPVDFRTQVFHWSGDYTFTDTATGNTVKFDVLPQAAPATGSTSTVFTITWGDIAPPAGYGEDIQVEYPGTTTWVGVISKATGDVDDVHAEQGHRQVQVPCPAAQPDELERDRVYERRDDHGQLTLSGGSHRTDGASRC